VQFLLTWGDNDSENIMTPFPNAKRNFCKLSIYLVGTISFHILHLNFDMPHTAFEPS